MLYDKWWIVRWYKMLNANSIFGVVKFNWTLNWKFIKPYTFDTTITITSLSNPNLISYKRPPKEAMVKPCMNGHLLCMNGGNMP
jgi:hypothetical protein